MPTGHPVVCRTLLDDGQTRCSVSVKPGRQSCAKHTSAYDASYKRYKDAEGAARDLRAAAQTKRGDVHTIPPEGIEPRIESVCAYIEALETEVRMRTEHDERFIGDPDQGHLKRLDALERQLTHHRDIVDALRTRLQRLKPAGQSTPPKARRHHRHTRSDPTPQPAPASSAPSPRPSQRRSHGKSNQRKGGHGKSCSVQTGSIQGQKEHLILEREEVVEEDDGPGRVANPAESSFRISDGVWVRDALVRGLVTECSGGGTAERVEDSSCQEESIAGPVSQREDERSVLSSGISMRYPAVDTKKTSPPLPSLRVPDGSRSGPKNINEDGTSQEYPESEDTSPRRSIPPYPVPHIVGEYPGVCPEDEERGSGAEPEASHQWRYLKYVFTGILSAAVIALIYTFAPIRDCMPKR